MADPSPIPHRSKERNWHQHMDTRPCSVCGGGDDEGTLLLCDECNTPFHNGMYCAGFITTCGYGDWVCLDCSNHQGNEDEVPQDEEGVSQRDAVAASA